MLDDVTNLRGRPRAITVDYGPEFIARALDAWANARQVQLAFIRPHGSLQQLTPHEYARTFTRSPQPRAYTS